jgi:hypothetical protein
MARAFAEARRIMIESEARSRREGGRTVIAARAAVPPPAGAGRDRSPRPSPGRAGVKLMSVRSVALATAAAFVTLGTMTFAVSPVFARDCGEAAYASAAGGQAVPNFRVSQAAD